MFDVVMCFMQAAIIVVAISVFVRFITKTEERRSLCKKAIVFIVAFVLLSVVALSYGEEVERKLCFLVRFHLSEGTFILMDWDGHFWEFELSEEDYYLGEAFWVYFPAGADPYYEVWEEDAV